MSEKGSKPFIPLGQGGNYLPEQPINRPTREQANAAKWASRVGAAAAERAASTVAGGNNSTASEQTPGLGYHEGMARANGKTDRNVRVDAAWAVIDEDNHLTGVEERMKRPDVMALNDAAHMELYGNDGRAIVDPRNGAVVVRAGTIMPGKLDAMAMDKRYGKTREQRFKAVEQYENRLNELIGEGFETAQAKMIADREDPAIHGPELEAMVRKLTTYGEKSEEATKKARAKAEAMQAKANQKFLETIRDNGIMTLAELDEFRGKKQKADTQTDNSSASTVPLPRRNIDDPASRAQLPVQPSRTDLHNANRAQRSQEKKNWKKRIAIGAAVGAAAVATAVGAFFMLNRDNDKTPDAPVAVQPDAPDKQVTAFELSPERYPTPFDLYVHEHGGDTAAAMAALNADADASINKNELRKVYLPGTDNYGDALWMLETPAGDTSKRMVVPPLASHEGGIDMAPGALDDAEEDK